MSHAAHQRASDALRVGFAVLTLSDTRTRETDTSGQLIRERLTAEGHRLIAEMIIKDESTQLNEILDQWLGNGEIDVIITNGGTGLSKRDQTVNTIESRFERTIPGFGELFRMLSHREIGSAAMLSRATAGVINGKLIFVLPGSTAAVRLGINELVHPQIRHIVYELRK